jgi:hypothetical protein
MDANNAEAMSDKKGNRLLVLVRHRLDASGSKQDASSVAFSPCSCTDSALVEASRIASPRPGSFMGWLSFLEGGGRG